MATNGLRQLFRIPAIPYPIAAGTKVQKDHLRRLIVQEHEAERALYKAMVTDTTLPLNIRLQVRLFSTHSSAQGGPLSATALACTHQMSSSTLLASCAWHTGGSVSCYVKQVAPRCASLCHAGSASL